MSDTYIADQWTSLRAKLNQASVLTIFGYGAPSSDVAAVELLRDGWGRSEERSMEEIEFIDVKSEDELRFTWRAFIHSHHYQVTDSYFDSLLSKHPRRTCEALWQSHWEARFREFNPVPKADRLEELWKWFEPLIEAEQRHLSTTTT